MGRGLSRERYCFKVLLDEGMDGIWLCGWLLGLVVVSLVGSLIGWLIG